MTIPSDYRGIYNSVTRYKKARYAVPDAEFLTDQQWIGFDETVDQFGYYSNRGSPEGVIAANKGSWCSDTSNGAIYVKTTDTLTTGWKLLDSSIIDYHTAKFIVSSETNVGGQYTTIASAVAAAQATGLPSTIFIMPGLTGVYSENLTWPENINLVAYDADARTPNVTIKGKLTLTGTGRRSASGIRFETNNDFIFRVTGTDAPIVIIKNCQMYCTNSSCIESSSTSVNLLFRFENCFGNLESAGAAMKYFSINAGTVVVDNSVFGNDGGSTTASSFRTGVSRFLCRNSAFYNSISTTGSGFVEFVNSEFRGNISHAGTGTAASFHNGIIRSTATNPSITISAGATFNITQATLDSSNLTAAIDGSGTLNQGALTFIGTQANITTTTQNVYQYNNFVKRTATSTTPYTVVASDDYISVDASGGAKTIRLPNSAGNGQSFTVKDRLGNAATNNITVTTPGGAVTIDGATTYVINVAYGSATFIWNGTSYEVR